MILRPYQDQVIRDIRASVRGGHKNVLAVVPTGGGKTVLASFIAKQTSARGEAIQFIVHRDFLIDQTAKTFHENGLDFGIVAAGRKMQDRPIQICSIDTLRNRMNKVERPSVRLWDEAHHLRAASWLKVHEAHNDHAIDIGLTATPERLDGKGMNPPFTDMVLGPTVAELMAIGMLSDYIAFAPSAPDMSNVGTIAGDYNQHAMREAMRRSVLMGDVVGSYRELADGKRFIYFCSDIEASKALAAEFQRAGYRAMHLDGETGTKDRINAAKLFANGDLDIMTNCSLFGEGYDLAAQAGADVTIEGVGLMRPTKSRSLHRQQIGRSLRPKNYKAIIIDHAGNCDKHGLPDDEVEWSLIGNVKKAAEETSATRLCKNCYCVNKITAVICKECGEPFIVERRNGPEHLVEVALKEIDKEEHRRKMQKRRDEEARAQSYDDFLAIALERGYDRRWAGMRWKQVKAKIEAQARAYVRGYGG